jgi:hypothetical protein
LRGELTGSNVASCAGITVTGSSPALRLCSALLEADHDPTERLEVYRGTTLALIVRSIGEGARLRVTSHGRGFVKDDGLEADLCAQDEPKAMSAAPSSEYRAGGAVGHRNRKATQRGRPA